MLGYLILKVKNFFQRPGRAKTAKIKKLIKVRHLTQKSVAIEILEITPEYFNNIVHNRNCMKLNPQKVPALAEALEVSTNEICYLFGLGRISIK